MENFETETDNFGYICFCFTRSMSLHITIKLFAVNTSMGDYQTMVIHLAM